MNKNERTPVNVMLHDYVVTFYHPRTIAEFINSPGETDASIAAELAGYRQANGGNKYAKSHALTAEQSKAWEATRRAIKDTVTDNDTLPQIREKVRAAWPAHAPAGVPCPSEADFAKMQEFADGWDMLQPRPRAGRAVDPAKARFGTETLALARGAMQSPKFAAFCAKHKLGDAPSIEQVAEVLVRIMAEKAGL